ncbi:hypothetical protein HMPREF1529_01709 [Microbacterium sp. oral taxon 186 str. F0373]|uniref:GNAT family N-acetyltransferase n=1 Tax=Microbacterium sp. oral taxon 186 TaxID=712383 RepID=UPI00034E9F89|nr:GNAT family N-acetyltransferase [Microbacterium sp. oral taxon 186]EPD85096.1 hypothetical protein HMPREF1529_01709 [Microbacterium sp. oral taxon 186 str. F0373]
MNAPDAMIIRPDDLTGQATRALVAAHLSRMHAASPACSVHALDIDALQDPAVSFWSAWIAEEIAGIGALKRRDAHRGELKSMRTAERFLGHGVGRALLRRITAEAAASGMSSLWLETGTTEEFAAARHLYASEGFVVCGPFGDYAPDPFSTFMTKEI